MKVILDTNVLISAFVFQGFAAKIFDHCVINESIVLSPWIVAELKDKLKNKFAIEEIVIKSILDLIEEKVSVIKPENPIPTVCRDKDDNYILQIAAFVQADAIITGDKDLLVLESFHHIPILSPRDFWTKIAGE